MHQATAKQNSFKNSSLLIISRASAILKKEEYFFQYLDGKYIDDIAKSFLKVRILCPIVTENDRCFNALKGYSYKFICNNIELVSLFEDKNRNRGIVFNIWKLIRQYNQIKSLLKKAEVVFVFMPIFRAVMGIYLARKMSKKVILYAGSGWREDTLNLYRWNKGLVKFGKKPYAQLCRYLEKWTMAHCPLRILNGYDLIKKYQPLSGFTVKTIPLVHIEKNDFYFREEICNELPVQILSVGTVIPRKGYEYLIKAMRILKSQTSIPIQLSIVGGLQGDDYEVKLRDLISQYNLGDCISFNGYIGNRKELIAKYRKSDIFVISSIAEGFPRVIWEAMSQGLPVIASEIVNIKKEFEPCTDVISFAKPKEPDSFAEQIARIINDKELCKRIRRNMRDLIDDIFYQSPAQQFIDTLNKL